MDERIRAMRRIWTEEQAEYPGEYVDFDPIYAWPKPVRKPHPPIYLGGESERAIARLAEYGDGWLPRGGTEHLGELIKQVRDRAGRQIPVTLYSGEPDDASVTGAAEAGVDRYLFRLPTEPRDQTLSRLDDLAALAGKHG